MIRSNQTLTHAPHILIPICDNIKFEKEFFMIGNGDMTHGLKVGAAGGGAKRVLNHITPVSRPPQAPTTPTS